MLTDAAILRNDILCRSYNALCREQQLTLRSDLITVRPVRGPEPANQVKMEALSVVTMCRWRALF